MMTRQSEDGDDVMPTTDKIMVVNTSPLFVEKDGNSDTY